MEKNNRRCNEPTIPALNLGLHPIGVSRRLYRPLYLILSLGLLGVAIPVQIQMMTHHLAVGLSVTLTGVDVCWPDGRRRAGGPL
jgi:hypothetical protein